MPSNLSSHLEVYFPPTLGCNPFCRPHLRGRAPSLLRRSEEKHTNIGTFFSYDKHLFCLFPVSSITIFPLSFWHSLSYCNFDLVLKFSMHLFLVLFRSFACLLFSVLIVYCYCFLLIFPFGFLLFLASTISFLFPWLFHCFLIDLRSFGSNCQLNYLSKYPLAYKEKCWCKKEKADVEAREWKADISTRAALQHIEVKYKQEAQRITSALID